MRAAAIFGAAALVLAVAVMPAAAAPVRTIAPPTVNPGALPPPHLPPHPTEETEQKAVCGRPVLSGSLPQTAPEPQRILDLPSAWQFSRGFGQTVAVIDTGVNRHPRLPILIPGGDYVSTTDGTADCDGHGTLVAGLIAARPSATDGMVGVAPDAAIIAIRQLSLAYEAKDYNRRQAPGALSVGGYGNVLTLAFSVMRAVELGATVINISEVACAPVGNDLADTALGAAVKYAYDRNIVVVAAAGNLQSDGACKDQNDGSGWSAVRTVASPAWFEPYVLAVAATESDGSPAKFSLDGPWVSVAAPGRNIVSLDSTPGAVGLVNASVGENNSHVPIDGTSFSSAYVAGVAALVRSRFPTLTAQQVMDRITSTAHAPGGDRDDRVGHGVIDPAAALTAQLPDRPVAAGATAGHALPVPGPKPRVDPWPKRIALIGAVACLVALGAGYAVSIPFRRGSRRRRPTDGIDY